jgi:FkbM family methyltransferase
MGTYRMGWALSRVLSIRYLAKVCRIVINPITFYAGVVLKLIPGLHLRPLRLRLKDNMILEMREFWSFFIFDEIFIQNDYEPPEIVRHRDVRTIIDVGANVGMFVLRAKQIWPDAQILAFEPDPANFRQLERHVELNRLDKVVSLQEGLSNTCGSCDLYLSPRNIGGHSMYRRTARSIRVRTRTLDEALRLLEGQRCDLLKIDCEGCERAIFAALTADSAERIRSIIVEPERDLYDIGALHEILGRFGFEIRSHAHLLLATRGGAAA